LKKLRRTGVFFQYFGIKIDTPLSLYYHVVLETKNSLALIIIF
jgi:hypothetical protein